MSMLMLMLRRCAMHVLMRRCAMLMPMRLLLHALA